MHLHLSGHLQHILGVHHRSYLTLKQIFSWLHRVKGNQRSVKRIKQWIEFRSVAKNNSPSDSSKNVTAFPLSQLITGRTSKT